MDASAQAFKAWALSKPNVITTSPLEQFRGSRIGIDADDYLHSLLLLGGHEPLLSALGGKPICLFQRVDQDLEGYRAAGIEPAFIFNGLDLACKDRATILSESRKASSILDEAWSIYDQGKGEEAVVQFGRASTYRMYHLTRSLQMYLHSKNVYVRTAPYSAAAQLVSMERNDQIDAIQGSASSLLFGAERIVVKINFDEKVAMGLLEQRCLAHLNLNRDQFVTACLISGSSILPMLPELEMLPAPPALKERSAPKDPVPKVEEARDLLRSVNFEIDHFLRQKDGSYHKLFYQAQYALKFPCITTSSGEVQLQNWTEAPGDAHEWIGQRLPEELYFYLQRGITGSRVLNWRTRNEVLETQPLDSGNSPAYKELVQNKLRPMRTQALALMTHSLNRYYQKTEVQLFCWWHELSTTPLGIVDVNEPSKAADKWLVKQSSISELSDGVTTASTLASAINMLAKTAQAKSTVASAAPNTAKLHDVNEIQANIVWRFLQARGYINGDHTLSQWGQVLRKALDHASATGENTSQATATEFEEAIFMALELVRLDILNKNQMFPAPPYSGGPSRGTDSDKANVSLISRVACLGLLNHMKIGYTGPLSRHLLAYHQCTTAVRGALRDLLEMHACHLLMSGAVDRTISSSMYLDIAASLPLREEPDIGLALVVKSHLDEMSQDPSRRGTVSGWFPHANDLAGDLQKAWKLWGAVNAGIQAAESNIINSDTKKMFQTADDWLTAKLKTAIAHDSAPNGTA